jgi:methionyl aminopeptidase
MVLIKTEKEIEIMREAGKILAGVMKGLEGEVKPGVSTNYLNKVAEDLVFKFGAKSAFKGYDGFPASLCVSINEDVVHCLPSERKIMEGDIISLDMGVLYKDFYSDMAITLPVGRVSSLASRLIEITKKSLEEGIGQARAGNKFGDIGSAIQKLVEEQGFGVVREMCGHGIGRNLHEEPQILNFGERGSGEEIKKGMVFCIEPMITAGDWRLKKAKDKYGFQTKDNSLAAHFEHTIAITESGPEILTSAE